MSGLIATKVGMSRVFLENGDAVAVTYLKVEPNTIVRTKNEEKDGYNAIVLGIHSSTFKTRKGNEHTKFRTQKEWKVETLDGMEQGKDITLDSIPLNAMVTVQGTSKGKGYQGVVKRHGFAGGPATHGSHLHRKSGSVGMREHPGRVLKGHRMSGRMGFNNQTLKARQVLVSDPKTGLIAVKGPVPGPKGASVFLTIESLPEA